MYTCIHIYIYSCGSIRSRQAAAFSGGTLQVELGKLAGTITNKACNWHRSETGGFKFICNGCAKVIIDFLNSKPVKLGATWCCTSCQDFDLCDECYQQHRQGRFLSPIHHLTLTHSISRTHFSRVSHSITR